MSIFQRSEGRLILNISGKKGLLSFLTIATGVTTLLIFLVGGFFEDAPVFRSLFIAAAALDVFYGLYTLATSKTITVYRENQVLVLRSYCFGLCYRSKEIPFTQVEGVNIAYRKGETYSSGTGIYPRPDVWSVYLVIGNSKKVKVYSGENKDQQKRIASTLSEILGKNVKHTNAPPSLLERFFGGASDDYPSSRPPSNWSGV